MPEKKKFDFTNKLMFAMVMRNEKLCIELLERILDGRKIRKIKFQENETMDRLREVMEASTENEGTETPAEAEKTIITGLHTKSVRLDVLFQDDEAWYDIEMQVERQDYLPQRSRYYHAAMTIDSTAAGTDYRDLKKSYVIFICMFDYFEKSESVYTIRMQETQNGLHFEDGQTTILVNMKCPKGKINERLRSFYSFVNQGEVDQNDAFIRELDEQMKRANHNQEVYRYMTLEEEYRYFIEKLKKDNLVSEALRKEIEADLQHKIVELKQAETELQKTETELQKTETELQKTETELQKTETELQKTETELQKTETELQKTETELQKTETELQKTETELQKTETELQKTETELQKTETELQKTETELQKTETELQKTEIKLQKVEAFNQLTAALLEQNRFDELKKAMVDEIFAQKLMEELQIMN